MPIHLSLSRHLAFHKPQQLRRLHPEAAGKIEQGIQGWAFLAAFQLPDVVPVIPGLVREGILGASLFLPKPPKYRAEGSLGTGGPPAPGC